MDRGDRRGSVSHLRSALADLVPGGTTVPRGTAGERTGRRGVLV